MDTGTDATTANPLNQQSSRRGNSRNEDPQQPQQQQQQQQRSSPRRYEDSSSSRGGGNSPLNHHHVHFGEHDMDNDNSTTTRSFFSRSMGFVTAVVASICACGLLTLLFILYFTVRPFSVTAYRRLSAHLGLACFLDAMVLLLPTVRIHLTGDSDVPSPVGTSIWVSNHLCAADWWVVFMLGRSVGLQGSMKAFLRNEYLQVNVEKTHGDDQLSVRASPTIVPAASTSRIGPLGRNDGGTVGHGANHSPRGQASPDVSLAARLLHLFLDFPLVNGEDYIADRENLFRLLRSFAAQGLTGVPAHFLFFPEGWCVHDGANRQSIFAMSNDFALKEGRPQLKHLLLPRTRGFNASLECLRESYPGVYDVTLAYGGYDGSLPPQSEPLSLSTLWGILRRKLPAEVYVRVKRYSLEEVLEDSSWLDKKWQEKDRLLSHFSRFGTFPSDSRGFSRSRVFDTFSHSIDGSLVALARLLALPCMVPILFLLSIPILWALLWIWVLSKVLQMIFPGFNIEEATLKGRSQNWDGNLQSQTPGSEGNNSAAGTPAMPATPFVSPTANWFSKID